ncbi:MAG: ATP-binding protein [Simkaniaceae bacterium]|nr:ATP-binding protein [Simkaniaceae bacterium]
MEDNIKCNQALADKKHISLCNELSENIYIEADFNQLSLVLNNFLSNAIKFSKENSKIRIYTNTENQRVRLSVSDEGRGISEDFKNKIFQRFVQEGALEHHIQTGSGLGLYISKEIIQRLGGEIGFVSEEAKGATFYFEFPVILK